MKSKATIFSVITGATLVFGFPLISLLKPAPPKEQASTRSSPSRAALLSSPAGIHSVFEVWQAGYERNGGDRNVVIGIGWVRGLSHEFSLAHGRVDLDMIGGKISAEVEGLSGIPADVWLVDNTDAPGMSITPRKEDRMVRVGRLAPSGDRLRLESSLEADLFGDFELDLVAVTRAGKTPADGAILYGSRSVFERMYTRSRLEQARQEESGFASILSIFEPKRAHANQILVSQNLVSQLVDDGANLFFRGTFNGNGRTCGTCHPQENNQTIDEAFIATRPASDPLFIAERPVSEGGVPGLERPTLMRNFGLILENVDGAEDPTVKFTMRGVPHSLSMATSILAPTTDGRAAQQRVGWSGDGAPDPVTLRLFSVGAIEQHFTKSLNRVAGVDFRLPTNTELDAMEAFMLSCGRTNELNLTAVSLTDARAEAGRQLFLNDGVARCNRCHLNAGANAPAPVGSTDPPTNNNFNTGVERFPNPARSVESYPFDGGFGKTNPFDCNGDTVNDCFGDGSFNTVGLVEIADTAPFFHGNSHETLEDAVAFFSSPEFQNSPAGQFGSISLTTQQNSDIADFLRVLNASFNVALSIQRNNAAVTLENSSSPVGAQEICPLSGCTGTGTGTATGKKQTVDKLLSLSNAEIEDAIDVLQDKGLHPNTVTLLNSALTKNQQAIAEAAGSKKRKSLISGAKTDLTNAKAQFGTGLNFTLGEGNLTF